MTKVSWAPLDVLVIDMPRSTCQALHMQNRSYCRRCACLWLPLSPAASLPTLMLKQHCRQLAGSAVTGITLLVSSVEVSYLWCTQCATPKEEFHRELFAGC